MEKIIIIGGSKGIGLEIVKLLVDSFIIVNVSRTAPPIQSDNLSHVNCNILTDDLPEIQTADHLIYCPGSITLKPFERLNIEDFKRDFEINFLGAVKAIQHVLPVLKQSKNSSILLFSTVACKLGMPFHSSIAAAKCAVEGLTKSLAAELAPKVRVNAIAPTVTKTELAAKLLRNEKQEANLIDRHPLKKILDPKEVATMAKFLLSQEAKSFSGQIFEMDCGITTLKL
ncbi:SDR family NAD(P)-dependent oxidoreductase [Mangrovimonas aestuarii]|uniref:SDR family NAD(P)-dependent oxidoreductase n=1 Tax=Mangrovimonas aestuarii TaxID=3018443 RepID=UPI002379CE7A|nr:SDR family oxidoreductase [Mangrovimonas aestuarii]